MQSQNGRMTVLGSSQRIVKGRVQVTSLIDLTGQVFGHWTVCYRAENSKSGQTRWHCECDCGTERDVLSISLRTGESVSCGRCRATADLVGQVFGRWLVLARTSKDKYGHIRWHCKCECGAEQAVAIQALRAGQSKSCGCYQIEVARARTGEKSSSWKGKRHVNSGGYVMIYCGPGQYVLEYRLVMEKHLGRKLLLSEAIHHKNGIKDDNALSNLELWSSSHPVGRRVEDLVVWAKELLQLYESDWSA